MKHVISIALFTLALISNNSIAGFTQAPEVNLPGINSNVQLEDFKGKVVYLDFWASWCLPCKKSFPWMNEMKENYEKQGFEVIAINLDKERKLADEFLAEVDTNFIIAYDESGQSASQYKVKGMPSSYLIGRDGKVYASHIGFRDKDKGQLEQVIKTLLSK